MDLRYPVIKLLDWRERTSELAASTNPFAVIVEAHLAAQETTGAAEARRVSKLQVIRGLFARGYERERILELLRLIDWIIALPDEQERLLEQELAALEEEHMPYVTSWERIAERRGLEQGQIQGQAAGLLEGQRLVLRRLVHARFENLPEALERRIGNADQEELNRLTDQISAGASLDELTK